MDFDTLPNGVTHLNKPPTDGKQQKKHVEQNYESRNPTPKKTCAKTNFPRKNTP